MNANREDLDRHSHSMINLSNNSKRKLKKALLKTRIIWTLKLRQILNQTKHKDLDIGNHKNSNRSKKLYLINM